MRRDGPMKFEEDFDFETANAQFHKDELDKELQNKLKLKGKMSSVTLADNILSPDDPSYLFYNTVISFNVFEMKTQMDNCIREAQK